MSCLRQLKVFLSEADEKLLSNLFIEACATPDKQNVFILCKTSIRCSKIRLKRFCPRRFFFWEKNKTNFLIGFANDTTNVNYCDVNENGSNAIWRKKKKSLHICVNGFNLQCHIICWYFVPIQLVRNECFDLIKRYTSIDGVICKASLVTLNSSTAKIDYLARSQYRNNSFLITFTLQRSTNDC